MPGTTKYNKFVDKLEFWADRIRTAAKPQFTVYVTSEGDWKKINDVHLKILKEHIPEDAFVLDAGCGYGRWSPLWSKYIGIDFSPDFIKMAQENYPESADDFMVADLKDIPFEDKQFDWTFCVSIKRMIIDNLGEEAWEPMEKELRRVSDNVLLLEYEDPEIYEILT